MKKNKNNKFIEKTKNEFVFRPTTPTPIVAAKKAAKKIKKKKPKKEKPRFPVNNNKYKH